MQGELKIINAVRQKLSRFLSDLYTEWGLVWFYSAFKDVYLATNSLKLSAYSVNYIYVRWYHKCGGLRYRNQISVCIYQGMFTVSAIRKSTDTYGIENRLAIFVFLNAPHSYTRSHC